MLRIELVKSPIGNTKKNRAIIAALGLRKMHQVVEHEDNPSIRGMVHRVKHLLSVQDVEGTPSKNGKAAAAAPAVEEAKPKASRAKKASTPEAEPALAEAKE